MLRHRQRRTSPKRIGRACARLAVAWLALALTMPGEPARATDPIQGTDVGVRWEPASGPVAHYRLWVSEDGGSFLPREGDAVVGTETTFTGRPGIRYRLAVTAHDAEGRTGPPSPASEEFVFAGSSSGGDDGSGSGGSGSGGRGAPRTAAASLLMSFAPPLTGTPAPAASAVLMPYAVNGPDEVTVLELTLEGAEPGLLQIHLLNHTEIVPSPRPGELLTNPSGAVFSFSCPARPGEPSSIVLSRDGSGDDAWAAISARCGTDGGERHFEIAALPGLAVSGYAFVSLLDPELPTRSRIEDRLRGEWTHLHFGKGHATSGEGLPIASGSAGPAAPGAGDFEFRFDGSEFATLGFEPDLPDRDADGIRDFVDLCPDVPGQDDGLDADGDTIPDACDRCDGADDVAILGTGLTNVPSGEVDAAGFPLWCSACSPAEPADADGDGTADVCDRCPGGDDAQDADGDGFPDACDLCPAGDDAQDADGDGVPDACDLCPGADDADDADGDGVPDACACPCFGFDEVVALRPRSCSYGGAYIYGASGLAMAFPNYCTYQSALGSRTFSGANDGLAACVDMLRSAAQQAGVTCY